MKRHDFPFSPSSRKVRAVAYELGIALETQRVDLDGAVRAIEAVEIRDGKILHMYHLVQPAVIALFSKPA